MLAISSDVDAMSPWEFTRIHRFLNTLTPRIPYYGDGIGLDIGDSFFFKNMSNNGLSVYDACHRYKNEEAWADESNWTSSRITASTVLKSLLNRSFPSLLSEAIRSFIKNSSGGKARTSDPKNARDKLTGKLIFEGGPNFIEKYIRCGWIDVLHGGDGNWGEFAFKHGATDWCRTDGQHYMEWVAERGLEIDTFTNHSAVSSDFGIPDEPSTQKKPRSLGDLPGSTAYWADYARQAGVKFYWSYIPSEAAAYSKSFGQDSMLVPITLRDGSKVWHFSRYRGGGHYADKIDTDLNAKNLDSLVEKNQFEVAYTHFGYWSDNSNRVNPELSPSTIDAFRLLKTYQDEERILVAKTSRLLRYNLAVEHLAFTATELEQGTIVDLTAMKDPQFGDFIPTVNDVRGVTFYVSDASKAQIRICDLTLPEAEIQRNPPDKTGQPSIGVKWFDPDYTDYTTWTLSEVNHRFSQ